MRTFEKAASWRPQGWFLRKSHPGVLSGIAPTALRKYVHSDCVDTLAGEARRIKNAEQEIQPGSLELASH